MASPPPTGNVISAAVFGGYLLVLLVVGAVYAMVTVLQRRNFWVAARNANLLLLDLVTNMTVQVIAVLRQVFSELGWSFPCYLCHLAVLVAILLYTPAVTLRALHLCVLYDEKIRSRYHHLVSRAGFKRVLAGLLAVLAPAWAIECHMRFCHSRRCVEPNCFIGSAYYFALPVSQIAVCFTMLVANKVHQLKIRDQVGVVRELTLLVGAWPVVVGGFVLAVLIDWNVISGMVWERYTTTTCLCYFATTLVISHVLPSIKFGYHPLALIRQARARTGRNQAEMDPSSEYSACSSKYAGIAELVHRRHQMLYTQPSMLAVFRSCCRSLLCEDSLLFLLAVLDLQVLLGEGQLQKVVESAAALIEKFVRPGSEYEINVESSMAKRLIQSVEQAAKGSAAPRAEGRRGSSGAVITVRPKVAPAAPDATPAAPLVGKGGAAAVVSVEAATAAMSAFYPAFKEVQKMLLQNVMPKLEASQEYKDAYALYLSTVEGGGA